MAQGCSFDVALHAIKAIEKEVNEKLTKLICAKKLKPWMLTTYMAETLCVTGQVFIGKDERKDDFLIDAENTQEPEKIGIDTYVVKEMLPAREKVIFSTNSSVRDLEHSLTNRSRKSDCETVPPMLCKQMSQSMTRSFNRSYTLKSRVDSPRTIAKKKQQEI